MAFHLTGTQRSANARRAAATRKAHGIPAFGGHPHRGFKLSGAVRSSNAKRAAATRRAEGIKPFGNMTAAQRHERAVHAAATRAITHPAKARTVAQHNAVHKAAAGATKTQSLSTHSRLHKIKRSNVHHQPHKRKLNPLLVPARKRPHKAVHVRRMSHFDRHKRMVL